MKSRSRSMLVLALCVGLAAPAFAQSAAPSAPETEAAPAADAAPAAPADEAPAEAAPAISPADAAAASPELQPLMEGQAEEAPAPMPEATPVPAPAPAPVVAAPPPAEPMPADEAGEAPPKAQCALGELCMGPVLSLAVINPFGFGAHARYGEHLGFGLDYQFLPTIPFGDVSAGWSLVTVEGRWYPFGGAFWLGGGFAYQAAHMSMKVNDGFGSSFDVKGNLSMPAIKFGLGLMGHDGFVMGIDLGAGRSARRQQRELPDAERCRHRSGRGDGRGRAQEHQRRGEQGPQDAAGRAAAQPASRRLPVLIQLAMGVAG